MTVDTCTIMHNVVISCDPTSRHSYSRAFEYIVLPNTSLPHTMTDLLTYLSAHEPAFQRLLRLTILFKRQTANFFSKPRLASLYSDFTPLKQTNPDGYAANITAWTSAIQCASRAGRLPGSGILTFSPKALEARLDLPQLGRPAALGDVIVGVSRNKGQADWTG